MYNIFQFVYIHQGKIIVLFLLITYRYSSAGSSSGKPSVCFISSEHKVMFRLPCVYVEIF